MNGLETIMNHAPALIVAIPLLGAFLTPLISRVNDKLRNVFVICILGITALLVFLLASEVFTSGPVTYVFGSSLQAVKQNTVIRILFLPLSHQFIPGVFLKRKPGLINIIPYFY